MGARVAHERLSAVLPGLELQTTAVASPTFFASVCKLRSVSFLKMAIDEPVVLKFKPTNSVIFGRVSGDDVRLKHDGYTLPEDEPFAVKSDLFLVGARGRLRCDFISLPSVDLKEAARRVHGKRVSIRTSLRTTPVSAEAGQFWQRTFTYSRDMAAGPVGALGVEDTLANLLSCAAVATFVRPPQEEPSSQTRSTVSAAISFIVAHAIGDVKVADIANAVGVSSRTLQYHFLEDCGCTPLEYVRRTRLNGVRRQMQSTPASVISTSAIATRWHFSNSGRFSFYYKQQFGEYPRDTVRPT